MGISQNGSFRCPMQKHTQSPQSSGKCKIDYLPVNADKSEDTKCGWGSRAMKMGESGAGSRRNWCNHFGKLFAWLLKLKTNFPLWLSCSIASCKPCRNSCTCAPSSRQKNVQSSIICNGPSQVPILGRLDQYFMLSSCFAGPKIMLMKMSELCYIQGHGLKCIPPQFLCTSPNPHTSECAHIWRRGLHIGGSHMGGP